MIQSLPSFSNSSKPGPVSKRVQNPSLISEQKLPQGPTDSFEPSLSPPTKPERSVWRNVATEAAYWTRKLALSLASPVAALFGAGLGVSPARLTGASKLHKQGIDGTGVRVAILDKGFTQFGAGSEDVLGVYEARSGTFKEGLEKSRSSVVAEHATRQKGMSFHGNAMACIVTGESMGLTGVAPGAEVVGVSVLDEDLRLTPEAFLQGLKWVAENHQEQNIKVISASVNYRDPSPEVRKEAQALVDKLRKEGVSTVVAAGNYGPGPDTVRFPADLKNVIGAGAYTKGWSSSNWDDRLERYSSRGGESTPGPGLIAPGGDIFTKDNHGLVELTKGTSNSAPMIAGALALLTQASPESTVEAKEQALFQTAKPLLGDPKLEGAGAMQLLSAYEKLTP